MKKTLLITTLLLNTLHAQYYYSQQQKIELTPIDANISNKRVYSQNNKQFFKDAHNNIIATSNTIIVNYHDASKKETIEQTYSLKNIKSLSKNTYLYAIDEKKDVFDIANTLYNLNSIKFAHPNFFKEKKKRTYDPLFAESWHLKNTGYNPTDEPLIAGADINVENAWQITKGAGVKVGIYDDAIEISHEDFQGRIVGYNNFNGNEQYSSDPSPSNSTQNHGTSCAGLIIANENDKGSVGVAPQASLYAVKYGDNTASDIDAFYWFNDQGVDIISNSWGTGTLPDALNYTFEDLANNGRNGKGIIILFATGNDDQNLDEYGFNDESESPYVLSIGATSGEDYVTSYSNFGSALDFVAPGGEYSSIVTTDRMGYDGSNYGNYTYDFKGTSSSAPLAAGVVALMLSVNPHLTRNDVTEILKQSSMKVGGNSHNDSGHSIYYGYGRINAGDAVNIAKIHYNTKLYPPSNLKFSNISKNAVTLSWDDNSQVESGFKIYRNGNFIYQTSPNVTSVRNTNLNENTSYTYTVKATTD